MFEWWWAYLALGAFVGFFAGLLGIGGGAAMVPVLAFIYAAKGFDASQVVHLALGTSMATILFTSLSSVRAHHRHGAVNWTIVKRMAPGIIIGTFSGALLASVLDVRLLTVVFTLLIYYISAQMFFGKKPQAGAAPLSTTSLNLSSGVIGVISSLTATGGAALVVAYLVKRGIAIHQAIGTAAAIGVPVAIIGMIGHVISGWSVPGLPPWSLGFVYLPALVAVVAASMLTAPFGARLTHRLPVATLKRVFSLLLEALRYRR